MSMDDFSTPSLNSVAPQPESPPNPIAQEVILSAEPDLPSIGPDVVAVDPVAHINPHDLATQLVAKLCHDFISPAGAIISGLDLLEDPSAQDMKQEALNLISASAKKLVTLVHFARVAFGAATTSEAFSGKELHKILADMFNTMRAELDFAIAPDEIFSKPTARALLNLGLIAGGALPVGGRARLEAVRDEGWLVLTSDSKGPRARLKAEAIEGLQGLALSDGLTGQWIQPYWLYSVVHEAGGTLSFESEPDVLSLKINMPI